MALSGTVANLVFSLIREPHNLEESLHVNNWKNAMDIEFLALQKNKT
jgi:hypothetical protein